MIRGNRFLPKLKGGHNSPNDRLNPDRKAGVPLPRPQSITVPQAAVSPPRTGEKPAAASPHQPGILPQPLVPVGQLSAEQDDSYSDAETPEMEEQNASASSEPATAATSTVNPVIEKMPGLAGKRPGKQLVPANTSHVSLTPEQRLLLLDTWRRCGLPAGDFAALVGVSRHTLYLWKSKFEKP